MANTIKTVKMSRINQAKLLFFSRSENELVCLCLKTLPPAALAAPPHGALIAVKIIMTEGLKCNAIFHT